MKCLPADVLKNLHDANQAFDASKQGIDSSMGDSDYDHQVSVSAASEKLRQAEKVLEEADEKVKDALKP